jgi:hypothetical protein
VLTKDARWVGVVLVAFALGWWLFSERAPADPDRHFHQALARAWAEHPVPRVLPQVEGIGWNERFVDKEFLFHVVTWLGFLVAGRDGVVVSAALLAALVLICLYFLCRRFLEPSSAALVLLAGAACPMFLFRLVLVRPHVLAIGATLLLLLGLLRESKWLSLLAGALFSLGYHALYVPLAVVAVVLLVVGRSSVPSSVAAAAGLALGTLVNPYFPQTLETTWMTLTIAASQPQGNTFGGELFPVQPFELVTSYGVPVALFVFAAVLGVRSRALPGARLRFVLLVVAGLFWALSFRSARATEYAIPFTVVAFAAAAAGLSSRQVLGLSVVGLLVNAPLLYRSSRVTPLDLYTLRIDDAVLALPAEASGQRVLNCSFTEGQVVLDLRPDVRVVDVLDPTFLERFNHPQHLARLELIEGRTRDVRALIADTFGARYVICGYLPARRLLDESPEVVRLRPPPGPPLPLGSGPYVYQLR